LRDTAGELFQLDLYVQPGGFVAAEHIHPKQEERFEVLAGTLRLRGLASAYSDEFRLAWLRSRCRGS